MSNFSLDVRQKVPARSGCRHFCADNRFEVILSGSKNLNLKWNFFSYIFIEIKVPKYIFIVKSWFLDFRRQLFFSRSKAIFMAGKMHENVNAL